MAQQLSHPHHDSLQSSGGNVVRTVDKALTSTVARAAFALPFGVFGFFHFMHGPAMASLVPIPGGVFWIYVTGAALMLGSLGILTGILGRVAAYGLAALMAVFIFAIHIPGLSRTELVQMSTTNLLKDLALMGGALTWAGLLGRDKQ